MQYYYPCATMESSPSMMNIPPTIASTMQEESSYPRRVSLDESSLKDIANLVILDDPCEDDNNVENGDILDDDDDDDDGEAIIIHPCNNSNRKRKLDEPSSSCLYNQKKTTKNQNQKKKQLLRFQMVPIILGTSAFVEKNNDVWYSRQELATIREDCKAAIVRGGIRRHYVAQEIMRLYNSIESTGSSTTTTTNTTINTPTNEEMNQHAVSPEFIQWRGLERWTSQVQYHLRLMASKTLRSELYIAQSLQRLHLVEHTTTTTRSSTTAMEDTTPQERLAEISRVYSQKAVALALRLAQVDAMPL